MVARLLTSVLRRSGPLITTAGLLALAGGPIAAAQAPKAPWATINVCDTVSQPDTIGIRGSVPGTTDPHQRVWMRFQVQYFSPADGRWHPIGQGGDSGFADIGPARRRSREAGISFHIVPNADSVLLRGVVTVQWRRGARVVHRAHQYTTADHRTSAGSDPAGYTAATCTIRSALP